MGGAANVERQHAAGRLTVRERISMLLDDGSFHEAGALAGQAKYDDAGNLIAFTPSNFVASSGGYADQFRIWKPTSPDRLKRFAALTSMS